MNAMKSGLLLGLLAVARPAVAEDASEAMRAFGLIGSWSVDCSTDMTQPCAEIERCYPRLMFIVPLQGAPSREIISPTAVAGTVYKSATAIGLATRISGDKISITTAAAANLSGPVPSALQTGGETWETVYLMRGTRLRVWSARQIGGAKIGAAGGLRYAPDSESGSGGGWHQTNQETPELEKCSN